MPPRFVTTKSASHPTVMLYSSLQAVTRDEEAATVSSRPGAIDTEDLEGNLERKRTVSGAEGCFVSSQSSAVIARPIDTSVISSIPKFTILRRTTRSTTTGPVKIVKEEADDDSGPSRPPASSSNTRKRRRVAAPSVSLESPGTPLRDDFDVKLETSPSKTTSKSTPKKAMPMPRLEEPHPAPARWEEQYRLIERMRKGIVAPVDTMGCERPDLGPVPSNPSTPPSSSTGPTKPALPSPSRSLPAKTRRFHVLISLMLSSQTKDAVTSAAVTSLHHTLPGGLTADSLASAPRGRVEGCINKVGFWRRKAEYIQEAAIHLLEQDGEVPNTIEGLCALKGVGPKMAFLAMQCAWDINAGIGVDVHVHRITNRLKWHRPPTFTPEQTRVNLESWLPPELHKGINPMLVGFGQIICLPVGPRCDICLLGQKKICPSRVANVRAEGRKAVEYTFISEDMEDILAQRAGVAGVIKAEAADGAMLFKAESSVVLEGQAEILVKLEEEGGT